MNALTLLLPEFILVGLAFLVFVLDLLLPSRRLRLLPWVAIVGLGVIVALLGLSWNVTGNVAGIYRVDTYSVLLKILFAGMAIAVILVSVDYTSRSLPHPGEYYGLLLFATVGAFVLASASELMTAYLGLEVLNFSLYVLTAYAKWNPRSNEAGVKYLLLGGVSSAILLYGLSLLYGLTGTTSFEVINSALRSATPSAGLIVSLAFILTGLLFKVAAAPFHIWAPDVYEGAPTPVTAFLSVASKAAGFALLARFFVEALPSVSNLIAPVLAVVSAVTMVLGNTVAIRQTNIKRMLAYSSIGQVGYLLLGVAGLSSASVEALVFHIVGYSVSNLAAFLAVIVVQNNTNSETIDDYAGLVERSPFVALCLTIALFSLAGMPLFAGFVTKFFLFLAVAQAGFLWLVALAILASIVSLYYYLMVIKQMFVARATGGALRISWWDRAGLAGLSLLTIVIGVAPAPFFAVIRSATKTLF